MIFFCSQFQSLGCRVIFFGYGFGMRIGIIFLKLTGLFGFALLPAKPEFFSAVTQFEDESF